MHSQNLSSTRKKAGTCAVEPHTLSPKALGHHPSFRLGKVRQPDVFPGALGHWAFNLVLHAELVWACGQVHQQADQCRFLVLFPPHTLHPAARHLQWKMCCTAFTRHESCRCLLSRSCLLPENGNFPAAVVPNIGQAQRYRGRLWLSSWWRAKLVVQISRLICHCATVEWLKTRQFKKF